MSEDPLWEGIWRGALEQGRESSFTDSVLVTLATLQYRPAILPFISIVGRNKLAVVVKAYFAGTISMIGEF